MSADYLDGWEQQWEQGGQVAPHVAAAAREKRKAGLAYHEIAGDLGITRAAAYRAVHDPISGKEIDTYTPSPQWSMSHLMVTVTSELGHIERHLQASYGTSGKPLDFNLRHMQAHLDSAREHMAKLVAITGKYYPDIGKEHDALNAVLTTPPAPAAKDGSGKGGVTVIPPSKS